MVATDEAQRLWRRRVAEAARRAAADIDPEQQPSLRRLHADLLELCDRLEAEAEKASPAARSFSDTAKNDECGPRFSIRDPL